MIESRRAVEELRLEGVMLRPNPYNGGMLHDPAYNPFWRELEGLEVLVAFHEGATDKVHSW